MRALFISHSIPPFPESQTIRNVFLLRGLSEAGWAVDVIAARGSGGDQSLLRLIPDRVRIHRAQSSGYDHLQSGIARLPAPWLRHTLRGLCARLAGPLLAPDVRRGWDRKVLAAARDIPGAREVDLIVSSAGSHTAHLAASVLARQWGRPWIAEYGDPWSLNPLPPASHWHIRTWNQRLERAALRYCSGITVTTRSTASAMRQWLGGACPLIEVIPCGFSTLPPPSPVPALQPVSPRMNLLVSYIGTASRGSRDLRAIMRALDAAAQTCAGRCTVTFQMAGSTSPAFEQLGRQMRHLRVESRGWVPYRESLELMRQSDLLLLVGNARPLQVPAKVFNYLASARPILYYGQGRPESDETYAILRRQPGVVMLSPEKDQLASQLRAALCRTPQLIEAAAARMDSSWMRDHAWARIGESFGAFAQRVCGAARAES